MKKKIKILLLLFVLLFPLNVFAEEKVVNIHLFYGSGCPHCAAEQKFLDSYLKDKENVKLNKYEVWYDESNQELLKKVQEKLQNKASGVPYTVIGDKVLIGFSETNTPDKIKTYVDEYLNSDDYVDPISDIIAGKSDNNQKATKKNVKKKVKKETKKTEEETVPILGKINPKTVSLPLLAVVIGFVDGFNPCAMWILIFLITMLFNMKDRKKMWILGLTFIITSGMVYLAFMLTWLNLATFISKIQYVRLFIAMVALVVGIINLSKYANSLTKKDEGCDVVDKKDRKQIMKSITKITTEKKFAAAIIGVMLLAASVNIIELMCSVGLPLLFTQILAMNDLSSFEYGLYIFIYILFFLIDDLFVFFIAMKTSKITAISTKYTKYSHLIGGIIMLIIGVLLIIKPEILMFNF